MNLHRISFRAVAVLAVVLSFAVLMVRGRPLGRAGGAEPLLYASNLHQPRGLAFTPDGTLNVAEAGFSGPGEPPIAGRISRLAGAGQVAGSRPDVVVDNLAAASSVEPLFAQGGPATLARGAGSGAVATYVFMGPAADTPLGALARLVPADGQWRLDTLLPLTEALPEPPSGPATVWGATVTRDGLLYAVLPLANQLVRLQPASAAGSPPVTASSVTGFVGSGQRNPQPVGVAAAPDGSLYVALFGTEPFRPGGGRIVKVNEDGRWQPVYESLSFPVALAVAPDGQLYVLEFAGGYDTPSGRFAPQSGRLLAVGPSPARRRAIVRELNYPTALAFAPSGDAYLTENGAFSRPGEGQVLRVPAQTLRLYR